MRRRADVDRKPEAVRRKPRIELIQHDAGLDGGRQRFPVEVEHPVEVLAVVDHQRGTDGLATLRTAGASGQHRNAQFAADVERGLDVLVMRRDQHADGVYLIDGRVGGVPSA